MISAGQDAIPALITRTMADIASQVSAYTEDDAEDEQRALAEAIAAAAHHFVDALPAAASPDDVTSEQFRSLGFDAVRHDRDLEPVRRSLRIATRHGWRLCRRIAAEHGLNPVVLGRLGDVLLRYMDRLDQEVVRGRAMDPDSCLNTKQRARKHLIGVLLADAPESDARGTELLAEAESAAWPLPSTLVVMRVSFHGRLPNLSTGSDDVLVRNELSPAVVICAADDAWPTAEWISRSGPGLRVAMSPPLLPVQGAAANRWALRAIDLVESGVITPRPIIQCRDHAAQIWLHAEPLLRQRLAQELLAPLLAEGTNSRQILSETMLAWLESRDSAPAIAARLGVHPQTVRYRWKRINELFGDLMHDSEFVTTVTMLLKATVPMWKAGNLSDVESFKTGCAC